MCDRLEGSTLMMSQQSSADPALFSNSLKGAAMISTSIPVLLVNWGIRVLRADMVGVLWASMRRVHPPFTHMPHTALASLSFGMTALEP